MTRPPFAHLPIARQIIALVTAAVLASASAMVAITLIGPPPRPAPTELTDIVAALRGRKVDDPTARPLRREISDSAPRARSGETRDLPLERWLAAQLESDPAAVRAFTAVSADAPPTRPEARKLFGEGSFGWLQAGQWRVVEVNPGPTALRWWLASASVTGLVLALIVALAWLWARTITRPLERLAEAVRINASPGAVPGPPEVAILAEALAAFQRGQHEHVAQRTRMLSAIAHDLGTPLMRLAFRLESLPEPQREAANGEIAAMRRLISNSLALDRGGSEPATRFDLAELVGAMIAESRALGLPVAANEMESAPMLGSELALRRLLQNLIDNALRYGEVARISLSRRSTATLLRVRDHGPGFSKEMLRYGPEPFTRGEASRNSETGGNGLGLAIATAIAEQHRGTLVLSNYEEGGEVLVALPLAGPPSPAPSSAAR